MLSERTQRVLLRFIFGFLIVGAIVAFVKRHWGATKNIGAFCDESAEDDCGGDEVCVKGLCTIPCHFGDKCPGTWNCRSDIVDMVGTEYGRTTSRVPYPVCWAGGWAPPTKK